ncbi:hypothetical protein [Brachybacterium sp. GPGPB12]|uniref:hypothetical protein n=1 Tax=Brachybacterium sp. GPGPB12 TaxID=3023517 RepID=UPI00313451FC
MLGGGIGAGVWKGGWRPAPKLALDLEGGTQVILQAQSRDGSAIDETAMEQARQIMSQRINAMGVAETEITVQGGTNIVIDVPGQMDQETSAAIRQTAAMSFRPVLGVVAPEGAARRSPPTAAVPPIPVATSPPGRPPRPPPIPPSDSSPACSATTPRWLPRPVPARATCPTPPGAWTG